MTYDSDAHQTHSVESEGDHHSEGVGDLEDVAENHGLTNRPGQTEQPGIRIADFFTVKPVCEEVQTAGQSVPRPHHSQTQHQTYPFGHSVLRESYLVSHLEKHIMVKGQKGKYRTNPPIENMKGFLMTCDSGKEKLAIQELKNIVEALSPAPEATPNTDDISKQIEAEIATIRKQKLLKTVETGCRGVIFVRLNTTLRDINPCEIVVRLFASKERQSRHIARLIPVLGTCNANNSKQIEKLVSEVVPPVLGNEASVSAR